MINLWTEEVNYEYEHQEIEARWVKVKGNIKEDLNLAANSPAEPKNWTVHLYIYVLRYQTVFELV
jgi:hypothetical protein